MFAKLPGISELFSWADNAKIGEVRPWGTSVGGGKGHLVEGSKGPLSRVRQGALRSKVAMSTLRGRQGEF